jgi:hypothetical protein
MMERCSYEARNGVDMFMFYEYDSVSIEPAIEMTQGLFGIVHRFSGAYNWTASRYANVPWRMDGRTVTALYEKMIAYPECQEHGCNDRLIPALAQLCGIPLMDYTPPGYGPPGSTVHKHNLGDLQAAKDRGARHFHGIKTPDALKILTG